MKKQYITEELLPHRKRAVDSNKGTFGHVLVIAGSKGMAGASLLAAKAALRSGCGLVTVHGPQCNRIILQTALPEAMFQSDINENIISAINEIGKYQTIVVGPGIGKQSATAEMLHKLLTKLDSPCVIDADALNIMAEHQEWLTALPTKCVLTPHPKEFDRLFGTSDKDERSKIALEQAQKRNCVIVLKGTGTQIYCPDGRIFINTTGNSGLATGGTGDILAGMIGGMLAQHYTPEEAAIRAVFLHGRKADELLKIKSEEEIIASDLLS